MLEINHKISLFPIFFNYISSVGDTTHPNMVSAYLSYHQVRFDIEFLVALHSAVDLLGRDRLASGSWIQANNICGILIIKNSWLSGHDQCTS